MQKYLKLAVKSLAVAASLGGVTLLGGFAYLQYVNSMIGRQDIEQQTTTKYYMQQFKMGPAQANRMYYWLQIDIAVTRILAFRGYTNYCEKLDAKIITPALKNYETQGLLPKIEAALDDQQKILSKKLFEEVNEVRKKNLVNIQLQQYIIKQVRRHQRILDTRKLVNVSEQKLQKVDKIHQYICQSGNKLNVKEVKEYLAQLGAIERNFPGGWLHKILYI